MPRKKARTETSNKHYKTATTPEARESQMIALAVDLAEQQLRDGTASAQVITHFLKLGTTRERIEKEILEKQKELITAKTESIHSTKELAELYQEAKRAMMHYSGADDDDAL